MVNVLNQNQRARRWPWLMEHVKLRAQLKIALEYEDGVSRLDKVMLKRRIFRYLCNSPTSHSQTSLENGPAREAGWNMSQPPGPSAPVSPLLFSLYTSSAYILASVAFPKASSFKAGRQKSNIDKENGKQGFIRPLTWAFSVLSAFLLKEINEDFIRKLKQTFCTFLTHQTASQRKWLP